MTSHDLVNINREVYKYTRSVAPSRSKWRLIDIITTNYIIYTHNFYTNGKPRISSFQPYAASKDPSSYFPKLWQVEHEINIKIGVTFFAKFLPTSCC